MKKLILISLLLIAGVVSTANATKYTIAGNSIALTDTVWRTMMNDLNDGSTYVNRAVSGKGATYFDTVSGTIHWVDRVLDSLDVSDVLIYEVGVNNVYEIDSFPPQYLTPAEDIKLLNKMHLIVKNINKQMVVGEIIPYYPWQYDNRPEYLSKYLATIQVRNSLRKRWCAENDVKLATTWDYFVNEFGKPKAGLYLVDSVHLNTPGSILLGHRYALADTPTVTTIYKKVAYRLKSNINFNYNSDSIRIHSINLSCITDTAFWYNLKNNGSNLSVYVDGVKVKRVLENYCHFAQTGVVLFSSKKIEALMVKANFDTTETNDSTVYLDAHIVRRYPMHELASTPTSRIDVANGKNITTTTSTKSYYPVISSAATTKYNSKCFFYNGTTNRPSTTPIELSGKSKFTISYNVWPTATSRRTTAMFFNFASSNTYGFRMGWAAGQLSAVISNGSLVQWTTSDSNAVKVAVPDSQWSQITFIVDLSNPVNTEKVKLVVNGVDRSSLGAPTGNFPTTLPTLTDNFLLTGYSSVGYNLNNCAFENISIIDGALTVDEAIADYREQTISATVISVGSGGKKFFFFFNRR